MNQFFMGLILVLGLSSWYLWNENQRLVGNIKSLEVAAQLQEETISSLQNDFTLQTNALNELQQKNNEIQLEMNRYLDIVKRHNLSKLAAAKPGLIEPRVNKATKEVFDGIEQDSRDIDAADDGIIVQSATPENN